MDVRERDGIVHQTDATTIIDTRAMPWVTFEGMGGSSAKTLASFDDGRGEVMLGWLPAGKAQSIPDLPDRHYHSSVAEYFYLLSGEVYVWDYASAADPDGVLIRYRPDYYLERQPGPEGIHGLEEGPVAPCGTSFLNWRTGVGIWAGEEEFARESLSVPYPPDKHRTIVDPLDAPTDGSGLVYATPTVRLLDTRSMDWEPYDDLAPHACRKVLSRDSAGSPSVLVVSFCPSGIGEALRRPVSHVGVRECFYVLSGELAIREYGTEIRPGDKGQSFVLKSGYFVDHRPGAVHEIALDVPTAGDAVLIYWRDGSGTLPGDPDFDVEASAVDRSNS